MYMLEGMTDESDTHAVLATAGPKVDPELFWFISSTSDKGTLRILIDKVAPQSPRASGIWSSLQPQRTRRQHPKQLCQPRRAAVVDFIPLDPCMER